MQAPSFQETSDDRLKHNEKDIANATDILKQLKPKRYLKSEQKYADDFMVNEDRSNLHEFDTLKEETGFIAQDVLQTDLSFCVGGSEAETYTLDYNSIYAVHVKATQELCDEIEALKRRLDALENNSG